MQAAQMLGGDSTTASITATLVFYAKTTISKISVPVTINDTTATKYTTITVTIGDYTFTERTDFDSVETGDRAIDFNVGYTIPANTTVTIKMSGANVYVNYGAATPYNLHGQIVVIGGSFEALLYVDTPSIWVVTDDNAGYPHIIGYPPDDTVFTGYQQPKPPNSWKIDSNNAGYPHIIGYPPDETEFTGYQDPKPLNSWKRDDYNNGGYPYTWGFTEIVPGQTNIFLKTADGLVTLTAYYKYTGGLIPLTFIKQI